MLTKLYGGQGPVYLKVRLVEPRADLLQPLIEPLLLVAGDEEGGVS